MLVIFFISSNAELMAQHFWQLKKGNNRPRNKKSTNKTMYEVHTARDVDFLIKQSQRRDMRLKLFIMRKT